MNKVFNAIAVMFFLLGIPFYLSIFAHDLISAFNLQGLSPFSLYFANLAGSALIFTALLLKSVAKDSVISSGKIAKYSAILFALLAVTRLYVLFQTTMFFPFLPELVAMTLMTTELIVFFFLSVFFVKNKDVIKEKIATRIDLKGNETDIPL